MYHHIVSVTVCHLFIYLHLKFITWVKLWTDPHFLSNFLSGYAGYFPIHPRTRLQAYRLNKKKSEQKNDSESGPDKQTEDSHESWFCAKVFNVFIWFLHYLYIKWMLQILIPFVILLKLFYYIPLAKQKFSGVYWSHPVDRFIGWLGE